MGPHDAAERLHILAHDYFYDLTAPEREVLRAAATGEVADLKAWKKSEINVLGASGGGEIRATLLEWICTDRQAQRLVTHKGLLIYNATVVNTIDLIYAKIPFPLRLLHSEIHSLYLYMATTRDIELSHSTASIIYLSNANINGSLHLASIRLEQLVVKHTKVFGHIFCNGAHLHGNSDVANSCCLDGYGLEVLGDLYLNDHFLSFGEVCLIESKIHGKLDCKNCSILNPGETSLNADRATFNSMVFISTCFIAEGLVRFNSAKVKGQFHCEGGYFSSGKSIPVGKNNTITSICLSADSAEFHSDVFLANDFLAVGLVRFLGASISGQLDCRNSHFLNENDRCIDYSYTTFNNVIIEPIEVSGEIFLLGMHATGGLRMKSSALSSVRVILDFANIGILIDTKESWPKGGQLELNGFRYDSIHETSPSTPSERFDWLNRQPTNNFYPQPYEELAAFYQRTGHDSFATDVRIEKENAHQRHFKNPIKRLGGSSNGPRLVTATVHISPSAGWYCSSRLAQQFTGATWRA